MSNQMANGYNHALIIPTSLHKKEGETPLIIHPLVTLVTAGTTGEKKGQRTYVISLSLVFCLMKTVVLTGPAVSHNPTVRSTGQARPHWCRLRLLLTNDPEKAVNGKAV